MNFRLLFPALVSAAVLSGGLSAPASAADDKKPPEPLVKFNIALDNCVKPQVPEKRATGAQQKQFIADMDSYRTCVSDYTAELRRFAEAHNKAATAYINAANLAVEDYNAYIKSVSSTFNSGDAVPQATNGAASPPVVPVNRPADVNNSGNTPNK
jgi:hypothetical protein